MTWRYDAPTGTWQNEDLSTELIARAENLAGCQITRASLTEASEYGRAITKADPNAPDTFLESHATTLAKIIQSGVTQWKLLPQLRAVDDSGWRCSCGDRFAMPGDFGRQDHGRGAHLRANPDHKIVFELRVGDSIAFYGVGNVV